MKVCDIDGNPQPAGDGYWAANDSNPDDIHNTNLGRVGIGTSTIMGFLSIARSAYVNDAYISFDTRDGGDGTVKRWGEVFASQQTDITDNINGGGMTDNSARNGWGISFGDNIDAFQVRRVRATGGVGTSGVLFTVVNNGNVGIGTTNPESTERLHVAGNIYTPNSLKAGNLTVLNSAFSAWGVNGLVGLGYNNGFAAGIGQNAGGETGMGISSAGPTLAGAFYINPTVNELRLKAYNGRSFNFITSSGVVPDFSRLFIRNNDGFVGIGTTQPWARIDVTGTLVNIPGFRTLNSANNRSIFMVPELGPGGYNWLSQNGDSGIFFSNLGAGLVIGPWASGSYGIRITAAGNVGIGEPSPADKLRVSGNVSANDYWIGALSKWASSFSDIRLKENIQPIVGVLDKLRAIKCVSFNWNEAYNALGHPSDKRQIGVIAQDLEQPFPELVTSSGDQGYKSVNYDGLATVLLEAIKEQQGQIEELKAEINALKAKIQ